MREMLGRLMFVLWILSGALASIFGLGGQDDIALIFATVFVSPIILYFVCIIIIWIVKGES